MTKNDKKWQKTGQSNHQKTQKIEKIEKIDFSKTPQKTPKLGVFREKRFFIEKSIFLIF